MTPARRRPGRQRWLAVSALGVVVVVVVAASSAVTGGGAVPKDRHLPAGSVDVVAQSGVPTAVLASRTLFVSSTAVVVVADTADAPTRTDAVAVAREHRLPLFAVAESTADAVNDELHRLGSARALGVGGDVPDLAVPVTDDRETIRGAVAVPQGSGSIALLSAEGRSDADADAARTTSEAAGAEALTLPSPDPRSSGAAVGLLKRMPDAPIRAIGDGFGDRDQIVRRIDLARTVPELPGGGQLLFPGRRVVALYGSPGAPELGPLGRQGIAASIARAKELAARYDRLSPVPVVPGFEIIVTVASAEPGPGGTYSSMLDVDRIRPWVEAAGKAGVYVTLDLQPGRTDFLTQAKTYRDLLLEPHVGLALDPEWRLKPDQVHLTQIGAVDPGEVNRTSAWLADLVAQRGLPQKALVLHQFHADMLGDRSKIDTRRDELAFVIHADGHGTPNVKMMTWNRIVAGLPARTWLGWKNFFTEDKPTFSPEKTMKVHPVPWFISYQ